MAKRKQKSAAAPSRQIGDLTVTRPVYELRRWSKARPDKESSPLFDAASNESQAGHAERPDWADGPGRSAAGEHRPGPAAAGGSLFQYYGHCCDKEVDGGFEGPEDRVYSPEDLGEVIGREYRIRPCRCRRWFCAYCGPREGAKLRNRLLARLAAFTAVYGVTLTLDGDLFARQEQGWHYVMENRLLALLVRELARRQHLHSKAYFWTVEFQTETEQAHWHLLLDATRVPYGELVEIWSRFRPPTANPLPEKITAENYKGHAPAFGSVRYTASGNREKAAYYATKYLCKFPKGGYPDWVLDRHGRMPRYGHSHRFFPRQSGHDPMCFCDECRGEVEPAVKRRPSRKVGNPDTRPRRESKTIRERLEKCDQSCTIVEVQRVRLSDGTVVDGRGRFGGKLDLPFRDACEFVGIEADGCWQIELDGPTVTDLEEFAKQRNSAKEAA